MSVWHLSHIRVRATAEANSEGNHSFLVVFSTLLLSSLNASLKKNPPQFVFESGTLKHVCVRP